MSYTIIALYVVVGCLARGMETQWNERLTVHVPRWITALAVATLPVYALVGLGVVLGDWLAVRWLTREDR